MGELTYDVKSGSFNLYAISYAKIKCKMDFYLYPFDEQECRFVLELWKNSSYQVYIYLGNSKYIHSQNGIISHPCRRATKTNIIGVIFFVISWFLTGTKDIWHFFFWWSGHHKYNWKFGSDLRTPIIEKVQYFWRRIFSQWIYCVT